MLDIKKNFLPVSFELVIKSKRNIFFRINLTKSITFRSFCLIFPVSFIFTEEVSIDEIKSKLFEYYKLNEENINSGNDLNNFTNRIKAVGKNIKKFVSEIMKEIEEEKFEFNIIGDIKKLNKIFISEETK